jgi:hypothetical protein
VDRSAPPGGVPAETIVDIIRGDADIAPGDDRVPANG